jgi:putative sigma-54 modulation protein
MRVVISSAQLRVNEEFRGHVDRRLHFALSRFSDRIRRVTVRLAETGRSAGLPGKLCRITVAMRNGCQVWVATEENTYEQAVSVAADRAAWAVARELDRARAALRSDVRHALRWSALPGTSRY